MSAHTKVSGVWKTTKPYVKVSGSWIYPLKAYTKVSGSWKNWHLAGGVNDDTYNTYDVNQNSLAALYIGCVQSDGKLLLGGIFTQWNGVLINRIIRLNADSTTDTTFRTNIGTGANNSPLSIVIQPDNKILIGGLFTTWNGTTVNRIVRLNEDGTRDTVFTTNTGTAADNQITTIALQSDGKILIGGSFSVWNGTTVNRIVRLNSDGTRDTTFTTNAGTAANNQINHIVLQSDGKILVGGLFTTWNGVTVNRIVRLNSDGTADTAFTTNTGTAAGGAVNKFALQSDGKIVVGGVFTTWNGVTVNRIVRLNPSGTTDTAFTTNTGTAANTSGIDGIAIQSDGKIVLVGAFTAWNGTTVGRIVCLNSDGTRDTTFTTNNGTGADSGIYFANILSNGKIVIGGLFTFWNNIPVNRLMCLNSDGTRDTSTFSASFAANSTVANIKTQPDGKILIGGSFNAWNNGVVNRIVRLNTDNTTDTSFVTNIGTAANSQVSAISVQSDNKILIGGSFSQWNGVTTGRIARLNSDGTMDTAFATNIGTGANSTVNSIAIQSDNKILVVGNFTTWNGTTVNRIVRLNSDGTRDTAFTTNVGTAADYNAYSIAIQSDGKILVGGLFTAWNGVIVDCIVRLNSNGTTDSAFTTNTGLGAIDTVWTIALQSDGKIVLGGAFATFNDVTVNRIVRLNTDGTRDTTFTTNTGTAANSTVNIIVIQSNGKILVGGAFTTWNGTTVGNIVRLNSDGTRDTAFTTNTGTGSNSTVTTIAIQSNDSLLIGGTFTAWNGVVRTYNARIGGIDAA